MNAVTVTVFQLLTFHYNAGLLLTIQCAWAMFTFRLSGSPSQFQWILTLKGFIFKFDNFSTCNPIFNCNLVWNISQIYCETSTSRQVIMAVHSASGNPDDSLIHWTYHFRSDLHVLHMPVIKMSYVGNCLSDVFTTDNTSFQSTRGGWIRFTKQQKSVANNN